MLRKLAIHIPALVLGMHASLASAAGGIYHCGYWSEGSTAKQTCDVDSTTADQAKQTCEKKLATDLAALCLTVPVRDGIFAGTDVLSCVFKEPGLAAKDVSSALSPTINPDHSVSLTSFPTGAFSGGYTTIFAGQDGNLTAVYRETGTSPQWSASCSGHNTPDPKQP